MTARGKLWVFRISTGLFSLGALPGSIMGVIPAPQATELFTHLGYPIYFCQLLSAWKVLGAIALWIPGRPRLKEWIYAGFFFDMTGACISFLAVGDPIQQALGPLVFLLPLAVS